ncbi:uroporphyrinogen-III C-methyltransferase [Xenophilus arseniciresistens]|uniref:Uroporphyrinogen-III C-methyltransferase n=1 Tax=Xenophilus arseniciresistens TaxID=1283306 RepID=A0AAE3N3L1_9BURK|nr:uroporphyrinogen-III C-methyltransferase [Xenophilus arseniciresistens]MDA7415155.1 uroporphyrinogen-III C-methyltransferase [Xenophilus arseniciresistens]
MSVPQIEEQKTPPPPDPGGQAARQALGAQVLQRMVLGLALLLALAGLVMAGMLWQRVAGMQEQLARQSADATAQATEARALARQAQDTVREAAGRLALMETRVAEVALQRAQLDELMQALSRSRDENLVVDIDAAVRLALEQAQATGNVQPLLAALRAGEQRVARSGLAHLQPLQRAMQRDSDRIRATASGDGGEALAKLEELLKGVDDLPVVNALARRGRSAQDDGWLGEAVPADASWWQRLVMSVRNEARALVRVSRIDRPEAVLLTPEQTFFLRENLKLKLLGVRTALLSRQPQQARNELGAVASALNRYFDPGSRRVQSAATQLQQLQSLVRDAAPARIDETLAALTTAAAGR